MAEAKKPVKKTVTAKTAAVKGSAAAKKPAAAAKKPTMAEVKKAAAVKKVAASKAESTVKAVKVNQPEAKQPETVTAVQVKAEVKHDVQKSAALKAKVAKKPVKKESKRGLRKSRIGKVISNKMNKTIVVAIVNKVPHPLYGKVVVTTTKFKAHDEKNECSIGDTVEITETRPLSRDKHFRLLRIVEKVK